jgi:hypothetical protein
MKCECCGSEDRLLVCKECGTDNMSVIFDSANNVLMVKCKQCDGLIISIEGISLCEGHDKFSEQVMHTC